MTLLQNLSDSTKNHASRSFIQPHSGMDLLSLLWRPIVRFSVEEPEALIPVDEVWLVKPVWGLIPSGLRSEG